MTAKRVTFGSIFTRFEGHHDPMIRCPQAGFGEWLRCRVDRSSRLRRLWKCRWPAYPFGFQQQEKLKDVYTVAD